MKSLASITFSLKASICEFIYYGQPDKFPNIANEKFAKTLEENSDLNSASLAICANKSNTLCQNLTKLYPEHTFKILVMSGWFYQEQPDSPFKNGGSTTGCNFHALAFFQFSNLLLACDLNTISKDNSKPYLQVFMAHNETDLHKLLNSFYACKQIYMTEVDHFFSFMRPENLRVQFKEHRPWQVSLNYAFNQHRSSEAIVAQSEQRGLEKEPKSTTSSPATSPSFR